MADRSIKTPDNVAGKWYVDTNCIACGVCKEVAPTVFDLNDDAGYAFVRKQPDPGEEETQANDAKGQCPVDAIGDDA